MIILKVLFFALFVIGLTGSVCVAISEDNKKEEPIMKTHIFVDENGDVLSYNYFRYETTMYKEGFHYQETVGNKIYYVKDRVIKK